MREVSKNAQSVVQSSLGLFLGFLKSVWDEFLAHRLMILALLALLSCGLAWLTYGEIHRRELEMAEKSAEQSEILLCSEEDIQKSVVQCILKAQAPKYDATAEYYDLKAQQDMAKLALLMLIVTSFGVVVVAFTLAETRKANFAATSAVEAAHAANDILRDEQRPWIKFIPNVAFRSNSDVKMVNFIMPVQNVGSKPALNVRTYHLVVDPIGRDSDNLMQDMVKALGLADKFVSRGGVVFPDDVVQGASEQITLDPKKSIMFAGFVCAAIYSFDLTRKPKYTSSVFLVTVTTKNSEITFSDVRDLKDLRIDIEQQIGIAE